MLTFGCKRLALLTGWLDEQLCEIRALRAELEALRLSVEAVRDSVQELRERLDLVSGEEEGAPRIVQRGSRLAATVWCLTLLLRLLFLPRTPT